ncbi:MOSC N-terminal beta barrel domain-containing protein [Phenylobacterium sp. J426]|uniref:MOSC domain-containing protein n=1 Tax=Phenylobacterium sp. J426 TaxID=2898439 RepID=UPI002150A222|nr:MOSC N-terminal beta barrel domain-containing protein [Phenylobacterium sp. J426]MCR5874804.1 MOSC N-terminal beta barrel domain-containing protein [Phenylobacterium sp. J426]
MTGHVAAIYRHPVKGFTPERLDHVDLTPGAGVPCDRIFAVENGPSGYDPAAPAFLPKTKFTVLMNLAKVAAARTRYDDTTGALTAEAPGAPAFSGSLKTPAGRESFAAWLTDLLGDDIRGPLNVVEATGAFRFFDHPKGEVSIINLASVRDLSAKMGVEIDPLRFRANLYVDGWPAWIENGWSGKPLMAGFARASVFKPIVRCAATHVDPTTAERDLDVVKALFDNYGHMNCGIYVHITSAGRVALGDAVTAPATEAPAREPEWA